MQIAFIKCEIITNDICINDILTPKLKTDIKGHSGLS